VHSYRKHTAKAQLWRKKLTIWLIAGLWISIAGAPLGCAKQWGTFWDTSGTNTAIITTPIVSEVATAWIKGLTTSGGLTLFNAVATDSVGNVYAAGSSEGAGTISFGNSITTNPVNGSVGWKNGLLVKYDKTGKTVWARSVGHSGSSNSDFFGVTVDASGNVIVAGLIYSTVTHDYGNSKTLTGVTGSVSHFALVKYNSDGLAQWAYKTVTQPTNARFTAVVTDAAGNIYAGGRIEDNNTFDFGAGVNMNNPTSALAAAFNWAVAKFNSAGVPQWAVSLTIQGLQP